MARAALTNNASTTLLASLTDIATSFTTASGGGAEFPSSGYFYATLLDAANIPEIVKVTTRATDLFTVTRGQDGTTARAFTSGAYVTLNLTAAVIEELAPLDSPTFTGTVTAPTIVGAWAYLPAGTRAPFAQAAAPTGWTQDTSDAATNRMLRVINTAGGGTAGTDSPIVMSVVPSHTHTYSGNTGNESATHVHADAGHTHGYTGSVPGTNTATYMAGGGVDPYTATAYGTATGYASIGAQSANHTHAYSGTSAANPSAANWAPRYIDMIICAKS